MPRGGPRRNAGGARKGAGRKPGSVTTKTRAIADRQTEGITPLEVMLKAMRKHDSDGDIDGAATFARDAAPYMHARLSAVESKHSGAIGVAGVDAPKPVTREEWIAYKKAELLAAAPAQGSAD